mgnify:CR=1 FL=1
MISLMMIVAAATTSFAKSNNTDVANAVKSVVEQVKQAPSGTVYGVVDNTKRHIIVATPFGKYTIEKKDGSLTYDTPSVNIYNLPCMKCHSVCTK